MAVNWNLLQGGGPASKTLGSVLGGYEAGNIVRQQQEQEIEDKELDQISESIARKMQDPNFNMDSSPQMGRLMAERPEVAKAYFERHKAMDQRQLDGYIRDMTAVRSDLQRGDVNGAFNRLGDRLEGLERRGLGTEAIDDTDSMRMMRILEEEGPEAALMGLDAMVAAQQGEYTPMQNPEALDAKNLTADQRNFFQLEQLGSAYGKDSQQYQNFSRMVGLLEDPELSSAGEKVLNSATERYFEATQQISEVGSLITDIGNIRPEQFGSGGKAKIGELLRNVTGSRDEVDRLRRRFRGVRNSQLVKNLPQGAASDTDIQQAKAGLPPDGAGREEILSYLRGIQKLSQLESEYYDYQAKYLGENKSQEGFINSWKNYARERFGKDNPMFNGGSSASTGNGSGGSKREESNVDEIKIIPMDEDPAPNRQGM